MSQTVILSVRMSCEGCSGAVRRVLSKMEGVESFDIDMKEQKVTVIGNVEPEVVLQTVAKTGKKSSFWEEEVLAPDAKPEAVKTEAKAAEVEAETESEVKIEAETEAATAEVGVEAETTTTASVEIEKTKAEEGVVVAAA